MKKRNWVLFATSVGQIVGSITVSGLNLAFPVIAKDFGVDMSVISWLSLISLMASAGLMLIFGRMGTWSAIKKYLFMDITYIRFVPY
jgi:MFS family permease